MSDAYKCLGQLIGAAAEAALYTVPASTQTVLSHVTVCNIASAAKTFRIRHRVAAAADDNKQFLYYDTTVPANETLELLKGHPMATTDILEVYSSDANVIFGAYGLEVT